MIINYISWNYKLIFYTESWKQMWYFITKCQVAFVVLYVFPRIKYLNNIKIKGQCQKMIYFPIVHFFLIRKQQCYTLNNSLYLTQEKKFVFHHDLFDFLIPTFFSFKQNSRKFWYFECLVHSASPWSLMLCLVRSM